MGRFIDRTGEIKKGHYGLMKIVEYNNARDIKVKFKTGYIIKTDYNHFKKGNVKDPLFPSIYGIGYFGIGKYKTKINNKKPLNIKHGRICYEDVMNHIQ